ncbi:hypothetical protein [Marivirga harenae]|uniref:hypothetical protein n=1 Tax=Marivirga harenae TaxID=2010992 RepID=UPI0026E06437|nr:hypothetical protein [Marivirga harenae]WKV11500.1 hypothetical protein Q3Y49_14935 [Marivirga harenae]
MKFGMKLVLVGFVVGGFIACESDKKQVQDSTASEKSEQVKQDFLQKKNEWKAKLNAEIDAVEERIEKAKADTELEKELEKVKSKLESNLATIESSTEKTWSEAKNDVKKAYDDVKNDLKDLSNKIESELN